MSDEPLLAVTDLVCEFHSAAGKVRAVDGVSFAIARGETFGLVGESGSGKSTVARMVVGLQRPTAGTVQIAGVAVTNQDIAARRHRAKLVQMVFQDPMGSLNPRRRIARIIAEPLEVNAIGTPNERQARVTELMRTVGLDPDTADRYPHQLSGGQRQRVAIARALALDPALVVCDEPVSALDVSIQAQVLNLFRKLRDERGLAYLFISHDLAVVRHVADRIAVMHHGRIVESGPTDQVIESPQHPYTQSLLAAIPPDPSEGSPT